MEFLLWFVFKQPAYILRNTNEASQRVLLRFNISFLLSSLFSPWHADISGYGKGFNLSKFFATLSMNLVSRCIGAFVRLGVVLLGVGYYLLTWFIGLTFVLLWYIFPILALYAIL